MSETPITPIPAPAVDQQSIQTELLKKILGRLTGILFIMILIVLFGGCQVLFLR